MLEIDVLDETTIAAAAKAYGSGPLDLLVNCAGVYRIGTDTIFKLIL